MSSSPDSAPVPVALAHPAAAALLAQGQEFFNRATTPLDRTEALKFYQAALDLLGKLPASPTVDRDRAVVLMNYGHAAHQIGSRISLGIAETSHRQATELLARFPTAPDATTTPEAAFTNRLNLAGSWINVATVALANQFVDQHFSRAREATTHALEILALDNLPEQHPAAAELSLLARRARCDALGQLIGAVSDPGLARDLADEGGDIVDDGLALVRLWEQRGLLHFRPLAPRLYHFGAQLYRFHQPHFLAEFLLEHLDPDQSPGATPTDPALYAIAEEALAAALQALRAPRIIRADDPATARQVETLRSLQSASQRLAELRRLHVPPP